MKFNQKYSDSEFRSFLQDFLPEDYAEKEKDIADLSRCKIITRARELGHSSSLGVYILEMNHAKETDPRVSIATDAFKILATFGYDKALVIFKNEDSENYRFSYLTISLDLNEKNKVISKYSNARRYSFYLGTHAKTRTPEQQLVKKGRIKSLEDLLERFSVEVVNKQFYLEVARYFDELVSVDKLKLRLPSISEEDTNTRKSFAVRLIGRIMFCWFLKQKRSENGQLVPDEILSSAVVQENYYHSLLEPLFFGILNTSIESRDIRNEVFDKVPYLNGGLFSPQRDDFYEIDRATFSSRYINTLKIDDDWFKSFFELLETYNFTIDENTIFDQELSVDPEMLGRIFENLLAEINPETGSSERKQTGSFYTPRQIVEYMVDQSLIQYLKSKTKIEEGKISALVSYDLMDDEENPLNHEDRKEVVSAIEALRVLDPACGSGAFPLGTLQKIVYILQQVDPDCQLWLTEKLKGVPELYRQKINNEFKSNPPNYIRKLEVIKNSIFGVDIQPIAVDVSRLRCFLTLVVESDIDDTKPNRGIESLPNLDFKFVCANTLIPAPEQTASHDSSLFGDDFQERLAVAVDKYFSSSGENKRSANNEIHKLIDAKVDEKLEHLSGLISYGGDKKFEAARAQNNKKAIDRHSKILRLWSSYKNIFENRPVDFFDIKYFFPSLKEGFDIVIGNPPYIQLQKDGGKLANLYEGEGYETFEKTGDIYTLFYERGREILKKGGTLAYITSNKWMRTGYGESLRKFLSEKTNPILLIDFAGQKIFESATVDTNILLFSKDENRGQTLACIVKENILNNFDLFVKQRGNIAEFNSMESWVILSPIEAQIKEKIRKIGVPLREWGVTINYGIKTGFNDAFIIDGAQRRELIEQDPKSDEIIRPILRGRDIQRYAYRFADLWLINAHNGIKENGVVPINIEDYPAIKKHLDLYLPQLEKRSDKGETPYNLRNCAYMDDFSKQKLLWAETMRIHKDSNERFPRFAYEGSGEYMTDKTCFFATGKNIKYVLGFLNSHLGRYLCSQYVSILDDGGYLMQKIYLESIPIPTASNHDAEAVSTLVDSILESGRSETLENKIDEYFFGLCHLDKEEVAAIRKSI